MSATNENNMNGVGAGTHLHRLLAAWGIVPSERCRCEDRIAEMDRNGPQWCRDNFDTIVDWLLEAADACGFLGALTKIVPGPARIAAQRLVWQAIVCAEGGS